MAITKITKPTEIEQWHLAKDNILYKKKKIMFLIKMSNEELKTTYVSSWKMKSN